ncbi:ATP-binding protein [Streptomyces sp. JJ38]|uniref:ATP-binding protein n=1 Tax=Streptomyces sp. JJ38 TaxID=2738128 RepID=UPI001C5972A9|nr:ATP-binding protein [Streptomyces sp. JJ38]MBW1596960.1 ATP-binding protein [Streptomyces sp. JJ38]
MCTIARSSHVRTTLSTYGLDELADPAELLTSEVVTNAHRYTKGPITVRAQWEPARRCLRVSTCDVSSTDPRVATGGGEGEGGRGLRILDLCAAAWGWPLHDPHRRLGGKVVWFELGERADGDTPRVVALGKGCTALDNGRDTASRLAHVR